MYISLYIYAPGAVSGGVEECTLNTRLLIYRYISVYISVCLLPSAAVWKSAEYTSFNIIYRHISVYVSVPAAVSGGCRNAHCTQASVLYIPIYWYISVYISVYNGCRQRRCI